MTITILAADLLIISNNQLKTDFLTTIIRPIRYRAALGTNCERFNIPSTIHLLLLPSRSRPRRIRPTHRRRSSPRDRPHSYVRTFATHCRPYGMRCRWVMGRPIMGIGQTIYVICPPRLVVELRICSTQLGSARLGSPWSFSVDLLSNLSRQV